MIMNKVMLKKELPKIFGVSARTIARWFALHKDALSKFGISKYSKEIPYDAVKYLRKMSKGHQRVLQQNFIYLCYVDYVECRELSYIGQDYEDCLAQISREYNLSMCEVQRLRSEGRTYSIRNGFSICIDEQRLNCFCTPTNN